MVFETFREKSLVIERIRLLRKIGKPQDLKLASNLLAMTKKPITSQSDYIFRLLSMARMNKAFQMFRYRYVKMDESWGDDLIGRLADVIQGDTDLVELDFYHIDSSEDASAYIALLRILPTLRSLKKLHLGFAPFSQPLFATIYISGLRVLNIGDHESPAIFEDSAYKNLCLFLESYPNLHSLSLSLKRQGDPGLSRVFAAMNKNAALKLEVFRQYSAFRT
jgi:hypothetical protein